MTAYIFRNYTVEYLFDKGFGCSAYGDISLPGEAFDTYIVFYQLNPAFPPDRSLLEVEEVKLKLGRLVVSVPTAGRMIIFTLCKYLHHDWTTGNTVLLNAIDEFNTGFLAALKNQREIKVIDLNRFLFQATPAPLIDWKYFFISQTIINPRLAGLFTSWFHRELRAIDTRKKKCLVLDGDNTLWGGVLDEDGVWGIKLGDDYPGNCYRSFQQLLAGAASCGILLAVCSKNNEADLFDLWDHHPHNLINKANLAAYRINWNDKASNIKLMAQELNIGLDAVVFLDDNPVEREWVKRMLPQVTVPEFPAQPYGLVSFFWQLYDDYFTSYQLLNEDRNKTQQYKDNASRALFQLQHESMEGYLSSLEMEIRVSKCNRENVSRIAQMSQKTNQFNLTAARYTPEELMSRLQTGAFVFCAGVKDRFGDNGITIAGIISRSEPHKAQIESYLLSCRILGRELEVVTLQHIVNQLFCTGVRTVEATYIPTGRNQLCADFYDKAGFQCCKTEANGVKHYVLHLCRRLPLKTFYHIIENGTAN